MKYELVFVSGADRHQRPYYKSSARHRAFNLAGYFRRRGYATVIVSQHVFEEHYETFETADLVSFHHPDISECMVRYLMNNKRKQILIADYDDLVFDVSSVASNPAVLDRSEDITNISSYLASKAEIGQMFDHRTASTVPLAEEASRIMGGETTVIHNALDPAYLDMAKRIFELRDPTGVKFAFGHVSSSASHNSDLTIISSLIADYLNEFPSERMLLLGPVQIPSELEPFRDQIKRKEVQSFYAIPSLLAQCRMVLRPLTSNKFSRCESSLEFFEAAAIGVSVAASPIPDIDRFESPLLHKCTNPQEWEAALRAPVLKETRLEQEVKGLRAEGSLARQASLWKSHFLETATHAKWE
ncbi:hypothetical protein [Nioella sp.]|uniref:hypothetical protein n=1 Tax=Nioella sp. TaxID=1912091 RepID=UPI003A89BA0B